MRTKRKPRSKHNKTPKITPEDRQVMPSSDWPTRSAPESRLPDGSHVSGDALHRSENRIAHDPGTSLLNGNGGRDHVDLGGENPNLLPLGGRTRRRDEALRKEPEPTRADPDASQLNIVNDKEPAHEGPLASNENESTSTLQHQLQQIPTSAELPQTDSGVHPARATYLHQSLINRITERLRDEVGLSPEAIADLLKRGAHLLPPPPADLGVAAHTATAQSDLIAELPAPLQLLETSATLVSAAEVSSTSRLVAEAVVASPKKMSPGILIPRNAGIKLRGVEQEPPLVNAPAPDRSKIVVASQYLFQHDLEAAGMMDERDVQGRLQGIQVIEAGRRGLRMPMKTYGTACVFFMRYRYHVATKGAEDDAASRYDFRDAALASLWLASKAEETPKKSKEILCAFRNTTLPPEEHLTPDDEIFENQAKLMINLERYLLEIVAFDFRARNCGELLAGLMAELRSDEAVVKMAMSVALDLYRTLAVLKQTRQALALACVEMAARFVQADDEISKATDEKLYARVGTSRQEVLETLFDLIELYLNHHAITAAGARYNINDFMRVSTTLRNEMKTRGYSRYTYIQEALPTTSPTTSPLHTDAKSTPTLMGTPQTPANRDTDRKEANKKKASPKDGDKILVEEKDIEMGKPMSPPPSFLLASPGRTNGHGTHSPTSPTSPTAAEQTNPDDPSQVREVVRFVLDASRARDEDLLRKPFHQIDTVDVTEHTTLYIPKDGIADDAAHELTTPATPPPAGKMRNGTDTEMRDAPSAMPSGPRGLPPMGPRGDRDRDDRRDRERDHRRRSPPPPSSRMYGRDDRYGRREDRRW